MKLTRYRRTVDGKKPSTCFLPCSLRKFIQTSLAPCCDLFLFNRLRF